MAIVDHVVISITADTVGVQRAAFGVPLFVSHTAAWAERVRTYNSAAEVAADFATSSPEYLAAVSLFSQSPHPPSMKIGRAALVPTKEIRLTPIAFHSFAYTLKAAGEGVTTTELTFTSDATATVAEITLGLTNALNGVTGKNYTAVDNTTHVTITGTAAGDWFAVADVNPAAIQLEERHADPGIATDLAAIDLEDPAWYCLLTAFNSDAYVDAAAGWVDAQKKIYIAESADSYALTTAATNGDPLDTLKTNARARTAGMFHHDPSEMAAAAWAGRCLALDPGSLTWKFKQLTGISATTLTGTYRANLIARNANFVQNTSGVLITQEGTMGAGGFIDTRRGIDWLDDEMSARVFALLAGSNKVPYTDEGVAQVESAVRGSLLLAVQRDVLAFDPAPVVTVPKVADVSASDKANRHLPDVKFSGTMAGAIHKVIVTGVVSV